MTVYRPLLKICGVANPLDAELVAKSGADFCGILVDVSFSERNLSLDQAVDVAAAARAAMDRIRLVVLLCDPLIDRALEVQERIGPHALQLLCSESPRFLADLKSRVPCQVWKTIHLPLEPGRPVPDAYVQAGADALLVDSIDQSEGFTRMGGTGKVADWDVVGELMETVKTPVFLAGGIGPENVAQALARVRPFGIDLCSGVEASKGRKDTHKLELLINNFSAAQAALKEENKK
jgi:phosphoribosylanthranilate isomerase